MTRPVDLILPDAGPLISLAHADRMELLQVFGWPVVVLDVVELECLKRDDTPDYPRLRDWFAHGHNQFRRVETPFRGLFEAALEEERSGRKPNATRRMGDATLAWFVKNVDQVVAPGVLPLILTEDRDFNIQVRGSVAHVLSTRSWLIGLAQAEVIPSAESVVADIATHGRRLSRVMLDEPGESAGVRSEWVSLIRR